MSTDAGDSNTGHYQGLVGANVLCDIIGCQTPIATEVAPVCASGIFHYPQAVSPVAAGYWAVSLIEIVAQADTAIVIAFRSRLEIPAKAGI